MSHNFVPCALIFPLSSAMMIFLKGRSVSKDICHELFLAVVVESSNMSSFLDFTSMYKYYVIVVFF